MSKGRQAWCSLLFGGQPVKVFEIMKWLFGNVLDSQVWWSAIKWSPIRSTDFNESNKFITVSLLSQTAFENFVGPSERALKSPIGRLCSSRAVREYRTDRKLYVQSHFFWGVRYFRKVPEIRILLKLQHASRRLDRCSQWVVAEQLYCHVGGQHRAPPGNRH